MLYMASAETKFIIIIIIIIIIQSVRLFRAVWKAFSVRSDAMWYGAGVLNFQ